MAFEPSQHGRGQGRGVLVAAGVGRSAHPVVENTVRRQRIEVDAALGQMPFLERQAARNEGLAQRRQPFLVLVQDENFAHLVPLGIACVFQFEQHIQKVLLKYYTIN